MFVIFSLAAFAIRIANQGPCELILKSGNVALLGNRLPYDLRAARVGE